MKWAKFDEKMVCGGSNLVKNLKNISRLQPAPPLKLTCYATVPLY